MVRWDGSTTDLGTVPDSVGPATDPSQSGYVLAEADGDGFVAVVRDAGTGKTVDRLPVPDLPKSYWDVPPLSLDGDTLYVGYRNETVAVDLASSEVTTIDGMGGGIPDVLDGRTVLAAAGLPRGSRSGDRAGPSHCRREGHVEADSIQVYDITTGEVREFEGAYSWGWTADSALFRSSGTPSPPATRSPLPQNAEPRLGGRQYES